MLLRQEEKSWLCQKESRVCWFVRKKRAGCAKKNEEYAGSSGRQELVVPKKNQEYVGLSGRKELVVPRRMKSMLFRQEEKSWLGKEEI